MTTDPKTKPKSRGPHTPKNKRQLNVYITLETSALLTAILERDGVPYSAQIDRAVKVWAESKGIEVPHGKHKPASGGRG